MPDIAGVVRPTTLLAILWFAAKFLLDARNVSGTVIWHHDLFKRKRVTEFCISSVNWAWSSRILAQKKSLLVLSFTRRIGVFQNTKRTETTLGDCQEQRRGRQLCEPSTKCLTTHQERSQRNHAMLNTTPYKGTVSSYLGTLTRLDKIAIQRFSSRWQMTRKPSTYR